MRITDLGGHSGCEILLCETEDNQVYVRKVSSDQNYNKRLEIQEEKQACFKSDYIKTPAVLSKGYTADGLFYFDMEYVQGGITLAEYMKSIEIGRIRALVEMLVKDVISTDCEKAETDETVFRNKIQSLRERLSSKNNTVIDEAIELLQNHSWKNFRKSACHGDLTLENIIIKDNQLYLIDFLDSFYDCWLMDISTLMQDVQTMWSYRHQTEININTLLRLIVFRDILMDKVKEISKADYIEVYYALLLKLIRIYPYTNDIDTYVFLNKKTKSIIDIIKKEARVCGH